MTFRLHFQVYRKMQKETLNIYYLRSKASDVSKYFWKDKFCVDKHLSFLKNICRTVILFCFMTESVSPRSYLWVTAPFLYPDLCPQTRSMQKTPVLAVGTRSVSLHLTRFAQLMFSAFLSFSVNVFHFLTSFFYLSIVRSQALKRLVK